MVHPPSSPSFWRWWLKAVDTHTVHLSPSHRILQVPTDISASSTSPSPPLCPTAALSADAFNLIAVALLVLLLCRGVGVLRELYRTFQLQECARAQNSAVLIEGLGHRVQALAGLNKTHLEAVAHQCQVPTPRLVPRVRLAFHLQPSSLRLHDAGNGRVGIGFSLLLSPSYDHKGSKGQSGCNVLLFWGVDWPQVAQHHHHATTTNNTAPPTRLTRALAASAAVASFSSCSSPSRQGVGGGGAMVAFSPADTVEWAALSARLASTAAAPAANAAIPTTVPLAILLTHQPPPPPQPPSPAAAETAQASLFLVGFSPTVSVSVSPSRLHQRDTPLEGSSEEEWAAAAAAAAAPAARGTDGAANNALMGLPRLTLLAHLCQASDGRLYTVQEAFGLPAASLARPLSSSREGEGGDEDDCIICLTERKAAILLPCRHCCACERCLPFLGRCPVCRAAFHRYLLLDDVDVVVEQGDEGADVVVDREGGMPVAAR